MRVDGSTPPYAVTLDGVAGCTEVRVVPEAPTSVLVTCQGPSFVDEAARRAQAGLFLLRMDGDEVRVELEYRVSDAPGRLGVVGSAIPLDLEHGAVVGRGLDGSETYYMLNLVDGSSASLLMANRPFSLGVGCLYEDLLILPDADRHQLARYRRQGAMEFQPLEPLALPNGQRLPPREVRVVQD